MSGDDIVERLRDAHQTVPIPSIASLYSDAADLLDAIDALHQPEAQFDREWCCVTSELRFDREWCCVCFTEPWPCKTHSLLHPEGGPS